MTPSQAAQEKPTSPRTEADIWAIAGITELQRMRLAQHGYRIEREAAAATPSLAPEKVAAALHENGIGCSVRCRPFSDGGGQYVACEGPNDHKWQAMTLAARLDEGSATPDQGKGEPR